MGPRELEPPHAKAKGSECSNERKPGRQALAAGREQACRRVRRPTGRGRGRATQWRQLKVSGTNLRVWGPESSP